MSGGSYNYAYRVVQDFAGALRSNRTIEGRDLHETNGVDRLAFAEHLMLVASAMHAIEWVDSGDCSPPADTHAIYAVIPEVATFSRPKLSRKRRKLSQS